MEIREFKTYTALGQFMAEWMEIQQYHYHNAKEMQDKYHLLEKKYMGDLEEDGLLQEDLNKTYDNILHQLKRDFPHFSRRRMLVFSYSAAGVPVELIQKKAQISCKGSVYTMKCLMKKEIMTRNVPRKKEYLSLLGVKNCRIG